MKEAAGEANLTVVAIILIGVIVAVVTPLVSSLMTNTSKRACCTDAGGVWRNNECTNGGSGQYDYQGYKTCVSNANANSNTKK